MERFIERHKNVILNQGTAFEAAPLIKPPALPGSLTRKNFYSIYMSMTF